MSEIVSAIFEGFGETITSLASGCKEAFTTFFYNTAEGGTSVISEPAKFFLIMMGIGLAMSVTLGCIRLIRNKIGG
jgi:hypothetical protein